MVKNTKTNKQNEKLQTSSRSLNRSVSLFLGLTGIAISLVTVWLYTDSYISYIVFLFGILGGSALASLGGSNYLGGGYNYKKLPLFIIGGTILLSIFFYCLAFFVGMFTILIR